MVPGPQILELLVLGCSSGFAGTVGEAAVTVVIVRSRGGIGPGMHIRSLAGRWGIRASMALGSIVDVSCNLLDSILVRRNKKHAVVLVVPCSGLAAAGQIDTVSWSCTGLVVAGQKTGCVRHRAQQQAHLCIVAEVVGSAAVVTKTNHSTVCSSRLAAD